MAIQAVVLGDHLLPAVSVPHTTSKLLMVSIGTDVPSTFVGCAYLNHTSEKF